MFAGTLQEHFNNHPPYSDTSLEALLRSETIKLECLAEGLIYKQCSTMFTAPTGAGKSILLLQQTMELSTGLPLFGLIEVKKPCRVYYLIRERPIVEIKERIKTMQEHIPFDKTRICFDPFSQGFRLYDRNLWPSYLRRIAPFKPDVISIDPIYADNPGLSKEEIATEFNAFINLLINETGAFVYLGHHPTKDLYFEGKKVDKEDNYFGSTFLKNHVTGGYFITSTPLGSFWRRTKDTHGTLLRELELNFDSSTFVSRLNGESIPLKEQLKIFIRSRKKLDRTFSIEDIEHELKVCRRTTFAHLADPEIKPHITNLNPIGVSGCYKVTGNV